MHSSSSRTTSPELRSQIDTWLVSGSSSLKVPTAIVRPSGAMAREIAAFGGSEPTSVWRPSSSASRRARFRRTRSERGSARRRSNPSTRSVRRPRCRSRRRGRSSRRSTPRTFEKPGTIATSSPSGLGSTRTTGVEAPSRGRASARARSRRCRPPRPRRTRGRPERRSGRPGGSRPRPVPGARPSGRCRPRRRPRPTDPDLDRGDREVAGDDTLPVRRERRDHPGLGLLGRQEVRLAALDLDGPPRRVHLELPDARRAVAPRPRRCAANRATSRRTSAHRCVRQPLHELTGVRVPHRTEESLAPVAIHRPSGLQATASTGNRCLGSWNWRSPVSTSKTSATSAKAPPPRSASRRGSTPCSARTCRARPAPGRRGRSPPRRRGPSLLGPGRGDERPIGVERQPTPPGPGPRRSAHRSRDPTPSATVVAGRREHRAVGGELRRSRRCSRARSTIGRSRRSSRRGGRSSRVLGPSVTKYPFGLQSSVPPRSGSVSTTRDATIARWSASSASGNTIPSGRASSRSPPARAGCSAPGRPRGSRPRRRRSRAPWRSAPRSPPGCSVASRTP